MYRAVSFALAAMAICATVAMVASHVDATRITSALGSSFTSVAGLSHNFFRRNLTSIHLDFSLVDRIRVLAIEHLHTAQDSAKEALIPFIDAGRHSITQAMKRYRFLRSADAPRLPRPSIESITYRPQSGPYPRYGSHPHYDSYPWDIPYCGPPQDPFETPSTVFLMMATSIITAMILIAIISAISTGSAILASMRFPWRCMNALLVRIASKLWKTWGTICEELIYSLLNLVASGFALLAVFSTTLLFFIGNFIVFAHNVDIGLKLRVPPPPSPPPPPPEVIIRYLADPEVPKLKRENHELYKKAKDNDDEKRRLLAKIDGLNCQLEGEKKRGDYLKKEKDLAVEEKKESDAQSAEQLGDHRGTIRSLLASLGAKQDELTAAKKSHERCQELFNAKDEDCKYFVQRILDLERELKALGTQLEKLLASQKEDGEPLNKELQERDEIIESQKKTIQDLEARQKKQAEYYASQRKSETAYTKRAFDREMNKMKKACQQKSADHKAAEAKLKAEIGANKAAEKNLQAENAARKQAEAALEAERKDRKAADSNVSEPNAEVALLKLKLAKERSLYYVDNGTQFSGPSIVPPPHLREKLPAKPPKSSGAKDVPSASQHSSGSAVPDKNMFKMPSSFNFGASSAEGIFGVDPSHKPETPPADPSASQPAPSGEQPEQHEPPESPL